MFWTSLAMTAATTAFQYIGQKNTADAQYQAQLNNNKALRDASISDMVQKGNDLNSRQQQETASTALNINNQKLNAKRAAATAEASSESAGTSFDMLMADYDQQYLNYADSQMQQLGFNTEQIQRSRQSIEAQAEGRINGGWDRRPINQPSLGLAVLDAGAGAFGAYDTYATRDPITGNYTLG
jgi:hypothetical protein